MAFYMFARLLQQVSANIDGGAMAKFCHELFTLRGFE